MRVASHQPCFLPWAGFWHKFASVDRFVLSAGIEWAKDGYLNRAQHNGAWLTLPVKVNDGARIFDAELADDARRMGKMVKTLQQQGGPYRGRLEPIIAALRDASPKANLVSLNMELIEIIARLIGAKTEVRLDISPSEGETKTERLFNRLVRNVPDMTSYYLGQGALDYFDPAAFGLPSFAQSPSHFDPNVSIVQLIAQQADPLDFIMSLGGWAKLT